MRTLPGGVLGAPTPDVRDHYSLGRVLGKGAFATTRLAKSKRGDGGGPPTVAVKSVAKARLASTIEVDAAKRRLEQHSLRFVGFGHASQGDPLLCRAWLSTRSQRHVAALDSGEIFYQGSRRIAQAGVAHPTAQRFP